MEKTLEVLERRFLENHNKMDEATKNHQLEVAMAHGYVGCEIAEIIAELTDKHVDNVFTELYRKYNLKTEVQ